MLVAHDARVDGSDLNSTLGVGVRVVAPEAFHMGMSVHLSSRRVDRSASASDEPLVRAGEQNTEKRSSPVASDGLVDDSDPNNIVWVDGP